MRPAVPCQSRLFGAKPRESGSAELKESATEIEIFIYLQQRSGGWWYTSSVTPSKLSNCLSRMVKGLH